ncbi:hypothetical protein PA598K_03071 [Paenibacillus sp. 598K]|nr:hypothetical protein PA598K_03071 [Paenibacillus sp. 598K]
MYAAAQAQGPSQTCCALQAQARQPSGAYAAVQTQGRQLSEARRYRVSALVWDAWQVRVRV